MKNLSRRHFINRSALSLAAWSCFGAAQRLFARQQQETIAGEEWRAMDEGSRGYDPDNSSKTVRQARENIKKIRMTDVEITLLNQQKKPAANVPVEIVQTKNAFPFGDQLWRLDRLYRFNQHNTDRGVYWRYRFKNVMNAANALCYWTERPRNDGPKTEDIQGREQFDGFGYCVDWAAAQGLTVKGHPLFWSIPKCWPSWLMRYDLETQMKFAETRVRDIVARFKGKVKMYDAVNESMWEPAPKNLSNRHWPHLEPISDIADYVQKVLRWTREEDPDAIYLINDYGMAQDPASGPRIAKDGTKVTAHSQRKRYIQLVNELHDRDAAPNAMGLQCHIGGWMKHSDQMAFYDEMATAGLPLHVTEFWASTKDLRLDKNMPQKEIEDLQATYIENYMTCAFGHPHVDAFFFWGFMNDAIDWRDYSAHQVKSLYTRIQNLLHQQWMTRKSLRTDENGKVRFRGFYGDYSLRFPLSDTQRTGVTFQVSKQHENKIKIQSHLI